MRRGPKTLVLYVELEDNCGAVLGKRKIEIPVGENISWLDDAAAVELLDAFLETSLPKEFN